MCTGGERVPGSAADALALVEAGLDYLAGPAVDEVGVAELGEILQALSRTSAKHAAAWNAYLARFDANDCHDEDGYQTSAAWLAGKTRTKLSAARGRVRQMRFVSARPVLCAAMAGGLLSESWAADIIAWTRPLPPEMRDEADRILLDAAAAGAELDDLAVLARAAVEQWKSQRPDDDDPGSDGPGGSDDGFDDRRLMLDHTFGGAGRLAGDLAPECAAALQAVLDALGKKQGPGDTRTRPQRFHDALQEACELLIRAKMVPDRAGSDTRVDAVISLGELLGLPGADAVEQAWLASGTGHHVYLSGKAAEAISCDALITPVVTGTADWTTITAIIELITHALTATFHGTGQHPAGSGEDQASDGRIHTGDGQDPDSYGQDRDSGGQDRCRDGSEAPGHGDGERQGGQDRQDSSSDGSEHYGTAGGGGSRLPDQAAALALTAEEWEALLNAVAKLAVRFVSGPDGFASALRRALLGYPCNSRSVPLDVGFSQNIPEPIRRAVQLRDRKCRWPGGCDRPPSSCDVHHVKHKKDGGPTSVSGCLLLCGYHHDICIHRQGWEIELLPDGEVRARGPRGQLLQGHGHGPPAPARAA